MYKFNTAENKSIVMTFEKKKKKKKIKNINDIITLCPYSLLLFFLSNQKLKAKTKYEINKTMRHCIRKADLFLHFITRIQV